MRRELERSHGHSQILDFILANDLYSALACYTSVASISCKVFPHLASNFQLDKDWNNRMDALISSIDAQVRALVASIRTLNRPRDIVE